MKIFLLIIMLIPTFLNANETIISCYLEDIKVTTQYKIDDNYFYNHKYAFKLVKKDDFKNYYSNNAADLDISINRYTLEIHFKSKTDNYDRYADCKIANELIN